MKNNMDMLFSTLTHACLLPSNALMGIDSRGQTPK